MTTDGEGLRGTVDVVESLGAEALLHVQVGERTERLVVQVPEPCTFATGSTVVLRPRVLHAFDGEGRRIEAA